MKACPNCSAQNSPEATFCMGCGFDLVKTGEIQVASPSQKSCPGCGAMIPADANFCTMCGHRFAAEAAPGGGKTMFFGAMQEKGRAKLILIKGGGFEGVSYNLNATDHLTGRQEGFILFPEDNTCSPRHANFFYFGGKFFVSDERSLNGVFLRIKAPVELKDGTFFRVGEQLFRASYPKALPMVEGYTPTNDGTRFLGSPGELTPSLALTHILEAGRIGNVIYPQKETFTIGRDLCDLNFPTDTFMSGKHARITRSGSKYFLADNGSKNGTFLRIRQEQELFHGDYVFVGQQLLRVEVTP